MAEGTIKKDMPEGVGDAQGRGYCKLPDGTLLQWGIVNAYFTNGVSNQGFYFNVPFVSATPAVMLTVQTDDSTYASATAVTISYTQAIIRAIMYSATTYKGYAGVSWFAIGRWK